MKTMTAEQLKEALIAGITFNEPITVTDTIKFYFDSIIDKSITYLPKDLTVSRLYLTNSKIKHLPENLTVEYLDLSYSKIKYIPISIKNLKQITVDDRFLPSIPYDSFVTCLVLFKNIFKIRMSPHESAEFAEQQFEERLKRGI